MYQYTLQGAGTTNRLQKVQLILVQSISAKKGPDLELCGGNYSSELITYRLDTTPVTGYSLIVAE